MSQISTTNPARRGRLFPGYNLPSGEIDRIQAENQAFYEKCQPIFERVKAEFMPDHFNWFVAIDPLSGDYFLDRDLDATRQKARQQYPDRTLGIFRLNETGVCDHFFS